MSLWDWLHSLYQEPMTQASHGWIQTGADRPVSLGRGKVYVRVRCVDLMLEYQRNLFQGRLPVLQSVVKLDHGGQELAVAATLGPSSFAPLSNGQFARAIVQNIPLTGWLPYNTGDVDILVGLLAAPGENTLKTAAEFLGKISSLVHVPYLSAATDIATKVADGAEKLLGGDETHGLVAVNLVLDGTEVRPGYYVAINADEDTLPVASLYVENDTLRICDGSHSSSVKGFDYLLLQVEVESDSGENWRSIAPIWDPYKQALVRLGADPDDKARKEAEALLYTAVTAARTSPDLTYADQDRIGEHIYEVWNRGAGEGPVERHGPHAALGHGRHHSELLDSAMALSVKP